MKQRKKRQLQKNRLIKKKMTSNINVNAFTVRQSGECTITTDSDQTLKNNKMVSKNLHLKKSSANQSPSREKIDIERDISEINFQMKNLVEVYNKNLEILRQIKTHHI